MMPVAEHRLAELHCDSAIFISDLHLSDKTPQLLAQFEAFCMTLYSSQHSLHTPYQWLIVLGDLFEGYCGDDDHSPCVMAVEQVFLALHQHGIRVAFMHGNRDFLLAQAFAARCHVQLLSDPCVLNHATQGSILLSHGDIWCVNDVAYQQFRMVSRDVAWQQTFLAQPLIQRQTQVQAYRAHSKTAQMDISNDKTDVVDSVVLAAAQQYGCTQVLHGHTHRPSERQLGLVRKYVLGDWDEMLCKPVMYATLNITGLQLKQL